MLNKDKEILSMFHGSYLNGTYCPREEFLGNSVVDYYQNHHPFYLSH